MRRSTLVRLIGIALVLGNATVGAAEAKRPIGAHPAPITVRGAWFNDVPAFYCYPGTIKPGPGTPPGSVQLSCLGGSAYAGAWTGHTQFTQASTVYQNGDIRGTYDEWFYGIYTADDTTGGIHWHGTYGVDAATNAFFADATIIGGTCGFAGSTGTVSFSGISTNGGYVGSWSHPHSAVDELCDPVMPPTLP